VSGEAGGTVSVEAIEKRRTGDFVMRGITAVVALPLVSLVCACTPHNGASRDATPPAARAPTTIPASAADVQARLAASPRHGEWAMVDAGPGDSVRAWVVYPERRNPAPVVIVVHEIFGLSNWVRGVADQLAADGFIAIAPDLLYGKNVPTGPDGEPARDAATAAIRTLDPAAVQRRLDATAKYGMALPAALPRYGIVGFCWGGGIAFAHAAHAPTLGAAVVYYGVAPPKEALNSVRAPVLGLYGGNDARVNATILPADSVLRGIRQPYEHEIYSGAGHGFLRQLDGQNGANLGAASAAWPRTVQWFRRNLRR
jgi:carboxymethylenebutenolidase